MRKLTKRYGEFAVPTEFDWDFIFSIDDVTYRKLCELVDRLSDYEDTELEPIEIREMIAREKQDVQLL